MRFIWGSLLLANEMSVFNSDSALEPSATKHLHNLFFSLSLYLIAFVSPSTILQPDSSLFSFSLLLLVYLIVPCPWDELDTSLLPPENLLHCIKESSGHRLCPQTRFRSPEKSTQRDSFRLQCTYVCVSAFAFRCLCVCVRACLPADACVCACACVGVQFVCVPSSGSVEVFYSLWKSLHFDQIFFKVLWASCRSQKLSVW